MDEQGTRHDTVFVEISERDIDDDDDMTVGRSWDSLVVDAELDFVVFE